MYFRFLVLCAAAAALLCARTESRDYLYPKELTRKSRPRPMIAGGNGQTVTYTAFDGRQYALTEYKGFHVSWLLDPTWVNGLSADDIRDLVDRSDLIYEHYRELIGKEPDGTGLLRIAVVGSTCGTGCGLIGAKGIEIVSSALDIIRDSLHAGSPHYVLVHEFAHNFDVFSDYLGYVADAGHAWTAFMEPYMGYYTGAGWEQQPPSEVLRAGLDATFFSWIRTPGVDWQTCVRDGACVSKGIAAKESWAGIWLWYAKVHGAAAVRRAMAFLNQYTASNLPPSSPESKEDLRLEALAAGVNYDIGCAFPEWKWRSSTALRTLLSQKYPLAGPACADADLSAAAGAPVMSETPGGDFPSPLAVPYPVALSGATTPSDVEMFRFQLGSARRVRIAVRMVPAVAAQSYPFLFRIDDPFGGWLTQSFIHPPVSTLAMSFVADLPAGNLTLTATMPPGVYTLNIFDAQADLPATWTSTSLPVRVGTAERLITAGSNLTGTDQTPARVRYWIAGAGFVGEVPFAANTSFDWVPAGLGNGSYAYRALAVNAAGQPVTNVTPLSWFTLAASDAGRTPLPDPVSVMPVAGSGSSVTATAVFQHPGGASEHYLGYILFLPTPNIVSFDAQGSCLIEYNRISNGIRLINDTGKGWLGPIEGVHIAPGAAPLSNSVCTVDVARSSGTLSENNMTVSVPVTFKPAMTGVLGVFTQEDDVHDHWTDMRQFGNWTAFPTSTPKPGPWVAGATPSGGSGSSATFTITAAHTAGAASNIGEMHIRINPVIVGGSPCHIIYFPLSNTLNLIDDAGAALVSPTGIAPGSGTLANSRCAINGAGVTRAISGSMLTLTLPVTFSPSTFSGTKNVYVNLFDTVGRVTHWVQTGTWTVQ